MTKKHKRLSLLVGVTLVALAVGFASGWFGGKSSTQFGEDFSPVSPQSRVVRFEQVALKIWGPVCGGSVTVAVAPLRKGVIGRASYFPHIDGKPLSLPFTHCSIVINSDRRFSDSALCQIVVHEVGHLAGHPHSKDPASVMFPVRSERNIPARCKTR